jgi:hypothetical protein
MLRRQHSPRPADPFKSQVLQRRPLVDTPEKPVKMIARDTGFTREHIQIDRRVEMLVDKDLGTNDFFIYVRGDRYGVKTKKLKRGLPKLNYVFQTLANVYWHNFRRGKQR